MSGDIVSKKHILHLGIIAGVSMILGAILQALMMVGHFISGFLAGSLLIFMVGCLLYFTWIAASRGRVLAWMLVLAFLIRLVYGAFLSWGLPQFGHDTFPQQTGFVFEDPYRRERHAWALANSDDPLAQAFGDVYETDQYGGLLAMSAFVYRYVSPDAFRPYLISILSAGAMAMSVSFLVSALKRRFDPKVVFWAGWILAFYPEGILLGSSQMREPFIILFFTILYWAATHWLERTRLKLAVPALILSAFFLLMFSIRVGGLLIGSIFSLIWVVDSPKLKQPWMRILGWALFFLALGITFWVVRDWFGEVLHWDALQTVRRSGRIQFQLSELPELLHFPFIFVYGLLQPVLPAAIAAPAPWIWHSLGIFRALGWYMLLPCLIYAFLRVWRVKPSADRRWVLVMIIIVWVGAFIASARAGGDQWDNPRYRTVFLPWMASMASWGLYYARHSKDRWLVRILAIEGVFLAFFTQWYLSRYYRFMARLELWQMVGVILVLSLFIVVGGWLRDRKQAGHRLTDDAESL